MAQRTYEAEFLNKFINKFKDISELTEKEKELNCTYYCDDGNSEVGFAENVKFYDMGYTCFIAKKYILQEKLEKLISEYEN